MNKAIAILYLYPDAISGIDFVVRDNGDGQYIHSWNLPYPQPTEEELLAAWNAVQAEPPEPTPPTLEERVAELERQVAALKNA